MINYRVIFNFKQFVLINDYLCKCNLALSYLSVKLKLGFNTYLKFETPNFMSFKKDAI
jgi:hypothetical protein